MTCCCDVVKGEAHALVGENGAGKSTLIKSCTGAVVTTLKSKGSLFEATPAQDPYTMAKKAVEVGYGVMNGKKPEQETILVPVKLITRENVNEYQGWTK
jgi:ribose transport system substrate-binding protein